VDFGDVAVSGGVFGSSVDLAASGEVSLVVATGSRRPFPARLEQMIQQQ